MLSPSLARLRTLRAGQFGGFASDSFYVGSWQASIALADLLQIALLTRAFGLVGYGQLALVIASVSLASGFFDVRMTTATTAFAAPKMSSDLRSAAGIFQFSYLVDGLAGLLGFAVVLVLAPFVGPHLAATHGSELMILFGITLLVGTVDDTSITILRLVDRFRLAAMCGVLSEALRVLFVWMALFWSRDLRVVLGALLFYSMLRGSINLLAATRTFRRVSLGSRLSRLALREVREERRAMLSMIMHTNIAAYARLATTQLPTVLIGFISGAVQVGTYKVGMASASMVGRLGDPAMSAIFPRAAKLWPLKKRREIRRLIGQGTLFVGGIVAITLTLVIVFRKPLVDLMTGGAYTKAIGVVLVLGALGHAVNAALFWNGQVLFAVGRARFVAAVLVAGAAIQVVMIAALAPSLGAKAGALAFLIAQLLINAGLTAEGIRLLVSTAPVEPNAESMRIDTAVERAAVP